jgi:hypothetical protein
VNSLTIAYSSELPRPAALRGIASSFGSLVGA